LSQNAGNGEEEEEEGRGGGGGGGEEEEESNFHQSGVFSAGVSLSLSPMSSYF